MRSSKTGTKQSEKYIFSSSSFSHEFFGTNLLHFRPFSWNLIWIFFLNASHADWVPLKKTAHRHRACFCINTGLFPELFFINIAAHNNLLCALQLDWASILSFPNRMGIEVHPLWRVSGWVKMGSKACKQQVMNYMEMN